MGQIEINEQSERLTEKIETPDQMISVLRRLSAKPFVTDTQREHFNALITSLQEEPTPAVTEETRVALASVASNVLEGPEQIPVEYGQITTLMNEFRQVVVDKKDPSNDLPFIDAVILSLNELPAAAAENALPYAEAEIYTAFWNVLDRLLERSQKSSADLATLPPTNRLVRMEALLRSAIQRLRPDGKQYTIFEPQKAGDVADGADFKNKDGGPVHDFGRTGRITRLRRPIVYDENGKRAVAGIADFEGAKN